MKCFYLLAFLISLIFFSCSDQDIEPYQIDKPIPESVKVKSIEYKIRSDIMSLNREYEEEYIYEEGKLIEIKKYQGRYNKIYRYLGEELQSRNLFDLEDNKLLAIDSFVYDYDDLLHGTLHYQIDENDNSQLRRKTEFYHNNAGQLIKAQYYRMPENEKTFTKEYIWQDSNVVNYRYYYVDENSTINIEEVSEYDQSLNHQCLNIVDIDEPISINNVVSMKLSDYIGNYDGILAYANEIEYNEHDLPTQIISRRIGVFNIFQDTITINYYK